VQSVVVGRPDDKGYQFDVKALPTLFLFRDGSRTEWWGDDWAVEIAQVKLLWVMPIGMPAAQAARLPVMNAIAKCIFDGVEIGRTPSWSQPNDPDPLAATQGSLFYTYAGFTQFNELSHRPVTVRVSDTDAKRTTEFPALELTYELVENLTFGITNRVTQTHGVDISLNLANGNAITVAPIVEGIVFVPPGLTACSPTSGSVTGGTAISLTGANFRAGAWALFGGATATGTTTVSGTHITTTAPASSAPYQVGGGVDVVVVNPDGQGATLPAGFLFVEP
jgi:hypothetical protein